jgi:hypothetical protein
MILGGRRVVTRPHREHRWKHRGSSRAAELVTPSRCRELAELAEQDRFKPAIGKLDKRIAWGEGDF